MPVRARTFWNDWVISSVSWRGRAASVVVIVICVAIAALDILLDDGLELLGDVIAFQGDRAFAVDIYRGGRHLAGAGQADADIGVAAVARAVDDTTHDRDVHGLHAGIAVFPDRHLVAQIALNTVGELLKHRAAGAPASWAGHHHGSEGAQPHALQDLLCNLHLATPIAAGLWCKRNTNGVAYALLQQDRQGCGGSHNALAAHAGFGQAQMQGVIAACGQVLVDGNEVLHMTYLAGQHNGIGRQAEFFGTLRIADGRYHQGIAHDRLRSPGLRPLAVFVHHAGHELVIQAAPVHADAHGLVVATSHLDHLREVIVALLAAAYIARVDAVLGQRLRTFGKLRQQLVAVVVKVANQRDRNIHAVKLLAYGGDFARRLGRVDRNAHQLGTRLGELFDLHRRGNGIGGIGIGHGLHHYGCVAADSHDVIAPAHNGRPGGPPQSGAYRQWAVGRHAVWCVAHFFRDLSQSNTSQESGTQPRSTA